MAAGGENQSGGNARLANEPIPALPLKEVPEEGVSLKDTPDVREPSLPMIGFYLSKFVLYIISGFIVLFLFLKEAKGSGTITIPDAGTIPDSAFGRRLELIRLAQEEAKNDRAYTLQIAQMILLNLLLPVLTAPSWVTFLAPAAPANRRRSFSKAHVIESRNPEHSLLAL